MDKNSIPIEKFEVLDRHLFNFREGLKELEKERSNLLREYNEKLNEEALAKQRTIINELEDAK